MAVGRLLGQAFHRPVPTDDTGHDDLTTPPQGPKKNQWKTTDSEVAEPAPPHRWLNNSCDARHLHQARPWNEAYAAFR
jgi:hypothetical protein